MSDLYGFSASDLRAFIASVLLARGDEGLLELSDAYRITLLNVLIKVEASGPGVSTVTALAETYATTSFLPQQGIERSLSGGLQYNHSNGDGPARGGLLVGLVDTSGFSSLDFTDTFSLHAGWTTNTVVGIGADWYRAASSWTNPGFPYSTYATSAGTDGTFATTRGIITSFGTHTSTTQGTYAIRGLVLRTQAPNAPADGTGALFCLADFGGNLTIPNGLNSATSLTASVATIKWDIQVEANV